MNSFTRLSRQNHRFGLVFGLVVLATTLWAGHLAARSGGVAGVCASSNGCSCHNGAPNANGPATVSISGPQLVDAGTTHSYTIAVTGGPSGSTGGFDLCATGGTLVAGAGSQIDGAELIHSNENSRSWDFEWTAPTSGAANIDFVAVAMATDGGGRDGDSWNWYDGAEGATFTITVQGPLPVLPTSWGTLKDRYK